MGKDTSPRFSFRHVMEAPSRIGDNAETIRERELTLKLDNQEEYRKIAKKAERLRLEATGAKKKFTPRTNKNKGVDNQEIERYTPKPRETFSRTSFTGRNKLKVKGFGPFA